MRKSWLAVCITNFLIAAVMGLLLRYTMVIPIPIEFRYFIHAHSHTAMLGWVYLMIYCFFVYQFVPESGLKTYNKLFWATQVSVIGMMISFPIHGYGLFSIVFSTLHIVLSYIFSYRIWKDTRSVSEIPRSLLRTALGFMVVSTLGAWSLGILANIAGKLSPFYKSAIQFFLHFQFNGWFVFAVLAIFFAMLLKAKVVVDARRFRLFYHLLLYSVILTWALPLSWFFPVAFLFYMNLAGLVLQVGALGMFLALLLPNWKKLSECFPNASKNLLLLSLFSFVLKIGFQLATALPAVAAASYKVRNLTIGFIHLSALGLITGFLFYFVAASNFLGRERGYWKWGTLVFYCGFLLTEILLFLQGAMTFMKFGTVDNLTVYLLAATALLPAGLLMMLLQVVRKHLN